LIFASVAFGGNRMREQIYGTGFKTLQTPCKKVRNSSRGKERGRGKKGVSCSASEKKGGMSRHYHRGEEKKTNCTRGKVAPIKIYTAPSMRKRRGEEGGGK